jgi:type I restriction enzyme, R subunit
VLVPGRSWEKLITKCSSYFWTNPKEERPVVLMQDWHKDQQSQTRVKSAIEEVLDKTLPRIYDRLSFKQDCDRIYNLIFERANKGLAFGMG